MKINEVFYSIQGESLSSGLPTVFLRLTECNLRCSYCDTSYSYVEGQDMQIAEVLEKVQEFGCKRLCITGGEPLLQTGEVIRLIEILPDWEISIETNGSLPVEEFLIFPNLSLVVDVKTPFSNEADKNLLENLGKLRKQDQIKFVIADRNDYKFSKNIIKEYPSSAAKIISSVFGQIQAAELVGWMLEDGIDARFQLQIHKYIWDSNLRGV